MVSLKELAERLTGDIQASIGNNQATGNQSDPRSIFQKEYHKVIFSDYFRSLANKAQVSPIPENDHTHTRLTHSLEVACLGYSFGQRLISEFQKEKYYTETLKHLPDILATACLVHDIGNPPFGHAGEESIRKFFKKKFQKGNNECKWGNLSLSLDEWVDLSSFDGNPNGFRIITRLAGKHPENCNEKTGFNFSPITLAAFLKYPYFSSERKTEFDLPEKFGCFISEEKIFKDMKESLDYPDEIKRHPLVYLVEAADDICNLVMDFEDAIKNGYCRVSDLWEAFSIGDLVQDNPELIDAKKNLENFDSNIPISRKELKALETIRSEIVFLLIDACFKNFKGSGLEEICVGKIKYSLLEKAFAYKSSEITEQVEKAREKYLYNSLYCHERKMKLEISGDKAISDLLELFLKALSEGKKDNFEFNERKCSAPSRYLLRFLGIRPDPHFAMPSDYDLCLLAIDFISQCSDRYLIRLHRDFTEFDT